MNIDSSSPYSSQPSGETTATEGPVPFPEESPFLSDHGVGAPAVPPTGRNPVLPPPDLSQFPPTSGIHPGQQGATTAHPRPSSLDLPIAPQPVPGATDSISSLAPFANMDELYAAARSTQVQPRLAASPAGMELLERLKHIQITTTDSLQGRLVELYLGMVTSEALVPADILLEGAERTGHFSRYKTSQQKLKSLEQLVLAELKLEADKAGGNAVVGTQIRVSLDHGLVLVVSSGTAVRVV